MYRASGIEKLVGKRKLLHDISLTCEVGECTAIIGPNGAGKTVLLKALSLVDPPTVGTIEIDGTSYSFPPQENSALAQPWPELTFVFQQLFLWPHLTIGANIARPAARRHLLPGTEDARLTDLTHELGISDLLERYPNQVSGGQRQRVAIARALALNPKWLLLDEPNSAQDVEQIGSLISLFQQLKRKGVGVLFSTHLLGFAGAIADKVVFLDQGRIVEHGATDILSHPKTQRMQRFLAIVGNVKA